jgi:hypothetical protein
MVGAVNRWLAIGQRGWSRRSHGTGLRLPVTGHGRTIMHAVHALYRTGIAVMLAQITTRQRRRIVRRQPARPSPRSAARRPLSGIRPPPVGSESQLHAASTAELRPRKDAATWRFLPSFMRRMDS